MGRPLFKSPRPFPRRDLKGEKKQQMEGNTLYLEFLKAKNDYLTASRKAAAAGLAAASGGNISVRIPGTEQMIIKPSGVTFSDVDESNLIVTELDGTLTEGSLRPTKETILHGGLYRLFPSAGAVVHVHPVYSIMCANVYDEIPLVTKQMKQIMDCPVPVCKIKSNTVDEKGMAMIREMLEKHPGACCFLLEEHGAVAFAKNAADAENYAELVEENSRVYWETAGRVR